MTPQQKIKDLQKQLNELKEEITRCCEGGYFGYDHTCRKEKKKFPQEGDKYWFITERGIIIGSLWDDVGLDIQRLEHDNCFRTEEDAKTIAEWRKAQKLTWMPEEGGRYWTVNAHDEVVEYIRLSSVGIAFGNVHETKEKAQAYLDLAKRVAEIKKNLL